MSDADVRAIVRAVLETLREEGLRREPDPLVVARQLETLAPGIRSLAAEAVPDARAVLRRFAIGGLLAIGVEVPRSLESTPTSDLVEELRERRDGAPRPNLSAEEADASLLPEDVENDLDAFAPTEQES